MVSVLVVAFRRQISACWREPVVAVPVLVIESDDWGPGPPEDAARLKELWKALRTLRDSRGVPPAVTLGVVLAVPDGTRVSDVSGAPSYVSRSLDAPDFASLRATMIAGRDEGVFTLQLHGHEHFWPPAVVHAAVRDGAARTFLMSAAGSQRHEMLPAPLQARWIDASRLPSTPLRAEEVQRAVADETACFERVFGARASVAVPVTFIWTGEVEEQWARHGVEVVVTPGTRYVGRDGIGNLVSDGSIIRNGDAGPGGIVYIVRDVYFEPVLGHTAEVTFAALRARFRLGRPTLLEMHRFNFTGTDAQAERSLHELVRLVREALEEFPQLRFMSTESLARALASRDPGLIDRRIAARIRAFVLRGASDHRLRKLAWASGLAMLALIALGITLLALPHRIETERVG